MEDKNKNAKITKFVEDIREHSETKNESIPDISKIEHDHKRHIQLYQNDQLKYL